MRRKILLLSAYDASSHKQWRLRLASMFPDYEWTQLALPARNFNWRIRGNSLQWGFGEAQEMHRHYDLLIATSMVDLSSLRGFIPALAQVPSIVYFHENQFVYPPGHDQEARNVEPQLVPLYAALCADAIIFNSEYNRSTFLQGAENLFQKLPDDLPANLLTRLENSTVVSVPLPVVDSPPLARDSGNLLEVVWNHRWEYDKGPRLLLQLIARLVENQSPIRLHIVGEQFRVTPAEFEQMQILLRQHASALNITPGEFGYIANQQDYFALLGRSDVVLSTALHDFQGLAMQEASAFGCTPLAPDNLVYPEYLTAEFLYPAQEHSEEASLQIASRLSKWQKMKLRGVALPKVDLHEFTQDVLQKKYAAVFTRLMSPG